jgi:MFS family permease
MSMYAAAPFAGPAIGPIVGGFIQVSGAGWRWLYWVCAIFSGCCFLLFLVALPETYAPVLLKRKAESLRKKTGNVKYTAPIEMVHLTKSELLRATLLKPFILLYSEPMLLAITLYMCEELFELVSRYFEADFAFVL